MVVSEESRTDEHEQRPDGNRHHHSDVRSFLRLLVVLRSQVALYDSLVGSVFLQGIEDTVEYHHDECQLCQVPVVGTE